MNMTMSTMKNMKRSMVVNMSTMKGMMKNKMRNKVMNMMMMFCDICNCLLENMILVV
jgi:hypothetical protein